MTRLARVLLLLMLLMASSCGGVSISTRTVTATQFVTTASAQPPVGGGKASCRQRDVQTLIKRAAGRGDALLVQYVCSSGWLVVLAGGRGPDNGLLTYVFEAEGQFWALQDRRAACAAPSPIPAKLRSLACIGRLS